MGLLNKIKSFFKKEKTEEVKEIKPVETIEKIVANCILCQLPIYDEERIRDFNGNKAHKRCVKRAMKATLNGQSIESTFNYKEGQDGI